MQKTNEMMEGTHKRNGAVGFRFDMEFELVPTPEEPVEEIIAALAAGKCGDCYACCSGYHEQCEQEDQ